MAVPVKIRFDSFELDPASGELRKSGVLLKIQPQPFRVLLLLIERAGQVVTREEIQRCLWTDATFVDFEHGINFSINNIRRALGDTAEKPRYVETLAKRGYRFIGAVQQNLVPNGPSSSVQDLDVNVFTQKRGWKSYFEKVLALRWLSAVALVVFGAAFTGAAYLLFHRVPPTAAIKQRRLTANPSSIPVDGAVISPDGKYLAFSDQSGIHLQLIGENEMHTLQAPAGFSPGRTGMYPAAWFPSGTRLLVNIVLGRQRSIWAISMLGGVPVKLRDDAAGQTVSPDGSLIAFTANSTQIGDREIWLMAPDGENAHKLVTVDEHSGVGRVVWSPDGQRIAYQRFHWEADKFQVSVEICGLKGTELGVLLSDPGLVDFWWGPEGRLIYSRSEPPPNEKDSNLWEIRIDARTGKRVGEPRRITNWAGFSFQDLTGSSDGRRLASMKKSVESDVYVGTLERGGDGLKSVRRLTLDEHDDCPLGWTPDSNTVVFSSNRNGPTGIFKQSLDQGFAEAISVGPGEALEPTLSPDGFWILYATTPKAEGSSLSVRLMRVPLAGGVPQEILKTRGYSGHDCGRFPGTLCVWRELTEREIVFWAFDPVQGESHEITRISVSPSEAYDWAVAPDGLHIAVTRNFDPEGRIRILSSTGEPERDVVVKGWGGFGTVNWQADGRGFFVSSVSLGVSSLLHVSMAGRAQVLWEQKGSGNFYGVSAPNGRYLAFRGSTADSNAWLIENF